MKKQIGLIGGLLIFILVSMNIGAAVKNDWLCVPGVRVGPITSKTSEERLKEIFGAKNVKREKILVAEGTEEITVAYVYKGSKDHIEVRWTEGKAFKECSSVGMVNEGGKWHTKDGIRVGAPLERINLINGKPFKFYGFGWDYGGWIIDWGKGKLDNGKLDLHFECEGSGDAASKYMGDGVEVRSDDPGLKKLGVKVSEMIVTLN